MQAYQRAFAQIDRDPAHVLVASHEGMKLILDRE